MLRKMHERENLDQSMQVKENINKLRQIVKENNTMKVTFNDGAMNVDTTTAKVFLEVYNKQKSQKQNQIVEKIQTKSGFLSMLEMMYKKIG
jgi:ribosome-binding factor A